MSDQANDDISRNNRKGLILAWLGTFAASIPRYIDTGSLSEMSFIWMVMICTYTIPTILYFLKKNSRMLSYLVVVSVSIALFATLYQQKGALGASFLLCVIIGFSSLFFDTRLTLFSMVISTGISVFLFNFYHDLYFPKLNAADFMELCTGLIVTGFFMFFHAQKGNKLVSSAEEREKEALSSNSKLKELLVNIETTSNLLDSYLIELNENITLSKKEIASIVMTMRESSIMLETQTFNAKTSVESLASVEDCITKATSHSEIMLGSSNEALEVSEVGKIIINDLVDGIYILNSTIKSSSDMIADLNNRSKEINGIVNMIKGIAGQINLLSLNASIEAARAGEQGKGFAVVADEIRKLADSTSVAVGNISSIINELSKKIETLTNQIDEGTNAAQTGIHIVDTTQENFISIIEKISSIRSVSTDTAALIDNLSNTSTAVFENIKTIVESTSDVSHSVSHISTITTSQTNKLESIELTLFNLKDNFSILKEFLGHHS